MELHYQLTYDDHREFLRAHAKSTRFKLTPDLLVGIIVLAWLVGLYIYSVVFRPAAPRRWAPATPSDVASLASSLLGILPWLLAILTMGACFLWLLRRAERKRWTSENSEATTLHVTPDGLVFGTTHTRYENRWPAFQRLQESPHLYILYVGKMHALLVPKRAFPSPADADAFRALVQSHIPTPGTFPVLPAKAPPPPT